MPEKEQSSDLQTLNKIGTAGTSAAKAVKAAAKAGAGNIAGAVWDVISDENLRNIIIATVLIFLFLIIGVFMLVGSAVTGAVQAVYSGYMEHWDERWEEQGVQSNGNVLYMFGQGLENASERAMLDTIADFLFPKTDEADNADIGEGSELTAVDDDDYRTLINSVTDLSALSGEDGVLRQRLDMIKGRVAQRGLQFETYANAQYVWEAAGISLATVLAELYENPLLFAGVDLTQCEININTEVFELTDLQALKILAAYSVQHDCLLNEIDMWDLMNYCGWFGLEVDQVQPFYEDSIYENNYHMVFDKEIGGIVEGGQIFTEQVENLSAPYLPVWTGSCASQWYYEELAQLYDANEEYDRLAAKNDPELLTGLVRYETDSNGRIVTDNFEKLSSYQTYGIIDRLYSASTSTLTIGRNDYEGVDEGIRETLDSLIDSLADTILGDQWEAAYETQVKYTDLGSRVRRTYDNYHSITLYPDNDHYYYIVNEYSGWQSESKQANSDGYIYFSGLRADTLYTVYEIKTEAAEPAVAALPPSDFIIEPSPETPQPTQPPVDTPEEPTEPSEPIAVAIDSFYTFPQAELKEAYQVYFKLDINYAARSVDEVIMDLLGLWPGSLTDTETGTDGREYASGHTDEEQLAKTWTDTYTDSEGNSHTIGFKRQQAYQTDAYEDIVLAIADLLTIDTAGLFEPDYGYGETIAEMAMKEYEYYTANNLSGGARYWDMVKEAIGWTLDYDTPYCACFVMTTAWQCDLVGEGKAFGDQWTFYCPTLWSYLEQAGATAHNDPMDGYKPSPGDIIFFGPDLDPGESSAHVGIVYEVREDGTLVTVEGNFNGHCVVVNEFSNYEVGSYCYYSPTIQKDIIIQGYMTPQYPATFPEDALYQSVFSSVTPSVSARNLGGTEEQVLVAGMTRFRWSQLPDVLAELEKNYPALYREAMSTAYEANDTQAFIDAWNVAATANGQEFQAAQQRIATALYYRPLAAEVQKQTGFSWTSTAVRENIFLALATTSDQQAALENILILACSGLDNNITDADFLAAMSGNEKLHSLLSGNQAMLWPTDPATLRQSWIGSVDTVLTKLQETVQAETSE